MSQSGRLTTNQPVPGAGIQTVTGNAGGAVPGDGGANLNIIGAGTITVTGNPATNTLTITSAGVPATYTTDTGVSVPNGAGNLNVVGGLNINTDNVVANTITINLDDDVTIAGDFEANNINALDSLNVFNSISSANGDITALTGIISGAGATFSDTVTITANGLNSTGPTILQDLNEGVVQVDAAHTLFSDNGANGQVLIGGAAAPVWNTLTAGNNINIVNAAGSITISADVDVPDTFNGDVGVAHPALGIMRMIGGTNINTSAAGNAVTYNLNPSINLAGSATVGTFVTTGTTLTVGTNLLVHGNAHVIGISVLDGAVTCGANLTANGNLVVAGTITGNSTLTIAHNAFFNEDLSVLTGDLYVTTGTAGLQNLYVGNDVAFAAMADGVLQVDHAHTVTATNGNPTGTNGQVLISGPVAPAWHTLTAGAGINITPGANSITITATGAGNAYAFRGVLNVGVPWPANGTVPAYYVFGTISAMVRVYDPQNCFYPGNGVNQATYTVPVTGLYSFTVKCCVGGSDATYPPAVANLPPDRLPCIASIYNTTTASDYWLQTTLMSFTNSGGLVPWPHIYFIEHTEVITATAGDVIVFRIQPQPLNGTGTGRGLQLGPNYSGNGQASVTGYKVS